MIKKIKSNLTAKIFLLTALLLTICCIVTYGLIAWLLPKTYPNQIDLSNAELYAYEAAQEMRQTTIENYPFQIEALLETYRSQLGSDLEFHIFDKSGFEVSLYDLSEKTGKTIADYEANKRTQEYSFTFSDDSNKYSLLFVDGSQAVNQATEALGRVFPYLIVTILLIAVLTSFIYSKYITAPIKRVNHISQKMAVLDFDVKCKTDRTDELGGLSENLNLLAVKLSETLSELATANSKLLDDYNREKQMQKQRTELFSAVSHELKTPITIVKGQLQGMIYGVGRYKDRDTYLIQSLEAVTILERTVQELLVVARMETPDYICTHEPFDIAALIKQCLIAQEDLFIQKDIDLAYHLPENLIYKGDRQLLKRVFDNLIANALAYSPQRGSVFVNLKADDTKIGFSVENTGIHIEEKELPQLFEAFYRTEQSRNRQTGGSGLGLYIVKKVLDLHNVKYSMGNTEDGVIFSIEF